MPGPNGAASQCGVHDLSSACDALNFGQCRPPMTLADVSAAFYRISVECHPDKCQGEPEAVRHAKTIRFQRANNAKEYLRARLGDPMDELHHGGNNHNEFRDHPGGDQHFNAFRLQCTKFGGTISGIRESELHAHGIKEFYHAQAKSMRRGEDAIGLKHFVCGEELHPQPRLAAYNTHFHFYAEFTHALDCLSSKFDPIGELCGKALRMHVTIFKSEAHVLNWLKYAIKDGNYIAQPAPAALMTCMSNAAPRKRARDEGWAVEFLEAIGREGALLQCACGGCCVCGIRVYGCFCCFGWVRGMPAVRLVY